MYDSMNNRRLLLSPLFIVLSFQNKPFRFMDLSYIITSALRPLLPILLTIYHTINHAIRGTKLRSVMRMSCFSPLDVSDIV
jgi:hypothetical protein